MEKRFVNTLFAAVIGASLGACGGAGGALDADDHVAEILDWREARLERLKAPDGYLNQVGLFWLEPGSYTFGGAPDNDIVFAGDVAPTIGVFLVDDAGVSMQVEPGVEVRLNGENVEKARIPADTSGDEISISHGSLAWMVIERRGRFGIRLRDFEHPFVESFGPLPYYDIDPSLRVRATLHRYDTPIVAKVGTVIEGLGYHPESPGLVGFDINGESFTLEAYSSGERLFYVFGDLTNQDDTYGAGRFLYSELPAGDDDVILDFNKAYSPPCAFNDFSTCPVASPRNRLSVRIEAGEKYHEGLHYSAAH